MNKINFIKPDKDNLNLYLSLGISLILLSFLDVVVNFTYFLPEFINYFMPLILGFVGFHFIRIEYSGNRMLDKINKKINLSYFNSILTLLSIFALIKYVPPILDWFIFDANISGSTKEECTGSGACWIFIKVWFKRFMYGMYPNAEQWRINTAFIILFSLIASAFFVPDKYKNYLISFSILGFPLIAFILIYFLISGGSFGLEWVETGAWGGLSLTFIVAFFALIFCFPIGIFLALGRRSEKPVMK